MRPFLAQGSLTKEGGLQQKQWLTMALHLIRGLPTHYSCLPCFSGGSLPNSAAVAAAAASFLGPATSSLASSGGGVGAVLVTAVVTLLGVAVEGF